MAADSVRNDDGSVTLKTTGKVASTPSNGDGTRETQPAQARAVTQPSPKVVKVPGRGPVPRNTTDRTSKG